MAGALRAVDVCFRRGDHAVLDTVSFTVEAGESLAVMGPSGSGKTTLLSCLAGIEVCDGSIDVDGVEVNCASEGVRSDYRRRHVGVVFQEPDLLDELSAVENVALILVFDGRPRAEALREARDAMEAFGVRHLADRAPASLSGGEAQRVALARALVKPASLLLADEPTGALDRDNAHAVAALLVRACRDREVPLVMATHDAEVAAFCDARLNLRGSDRRTAGRIG